jgi:outer membrane protein OmpA-like peptidoglycan-associated protein
MSPRDRGWSIAAALVGGLVGVVGVGPASELASPIAFAGAKGRPRATPAPQLQLDKSKVDLAGHQLELRMSLPPARVEIRVVSETNEVLAEETHDFTGRDAGSALMVTWSPASAAPVARIDLKAYDTTGGFAGIAVVAWSLSIPHEEVVFRTDSAEIDALERPKLEASLQKIAAALRAHRVDFGRPTLFIAGHTDTVGSDAHNLKLSQARAQAIARWFRAHGVGIAVAYEGFGEFAPAVQTPDNTDEPRNRRVDYILSIDEPVLRTQGFHASWKHSN